MTNKMTDIIKDNNLRISIKENNSYIEVPIEILEQDKQLLKDYIKIYTSLENLKEFIADYIFNKDSKISIGTVSNAIL